MAEARIGLLVVAPLDLAAFGGRRVAGVAHIGGVALVAQQRPADLLAGAGELVIGPEEGERMVDRHDRQVLARHLGDQAAPEAGADHDMIGLDRAAVGDDALDAAVLDDERLGRRVGEGLELAGGLGLVDQLAGDRLRARDDEAGIGIPQAALHQVLFDQRELLLDLGRADQAGARAEGLAGGDLALDLVHAGIVADAGDLEAADAGVMAHLLVEIDGVERRPAGEEVMAGGVAEVGGMGRRADIGRDARLVDADDVVPAALDQVMGDRGADDAAEPDDDDLRLLRKSGHGRGASQGYCRQTIGRRGGAVEACLRHSRDTERQPWSSPGMSGLGRTTFASREGVMDGRRLPWGQVGRPSTVCRGRAGVVFFCSPIGANFAAADPKIRLTEEAEGRRRSRRRACTSLRRAADPPRTPRLRVKTTCRRADLSVFDQIGAAIDNPGG